MLFPPIVDVVIAGGGPAGAATAIALRRRGVDVVLFDRAAFPRDKVCGDVLLPEARAGLRSLGLDLTALKARSYQCDGVRYVGAHDTEVAGGFKDAEGRPRPWWMVRRREFDNWLIDEARRCGARVIENTAVDSLVFEGNAVSGVRIRGRGGVITRVRSRIVIGADGASSVVARSVGAFSQKPEHTCLAGRAYVNGVTLPEPYLEVFTTPRALPGCAWIVPVSGNEVNVGIGLIQSTANQIGCTPQSLFSELRSESPLLQERLRDAGPIKLQGWMLPAATERRRLAGPGWLLVGDAGAMVDPFTGHGIHNAIAAGRFAADAVVQALRHLDATDSLAAYETRCRRAFDTDIDRGLLLQRLHARPGLMRAAVNACSRHAGLRDLFLALVGHSAPRHELLAPASIARAAAAWHGQGAAA